MYQTRTIPEIKKIGNWLIVYTGWKINGPHLDTPFGCIYTMNCAGTEYVCKGRFGKSDDEFESENEMLRFVKSN